MNPYKKLLKCLLLFCATLIFLSCTSRFGEAAAYYVAQGGNDDNPGTEARPWASLDKAADTMKAGDTVYVKDGTYSGFDVSRSGTPDNYISYLAYTGATPKIGQIYFQNGASYNRFVGFEITPASGGGVIMDHNNDRNIISRCHIHQSESVGIDLSGGSDFNIIEDCIVYDVLYAFHTSGTTNRGNIFRRNVCYNTSDDGVNFSPSTQDTQFLNNKIYNAADDGIHCFDDGAAIISGNIVYNCKGVALWPHGSGGIITKNNTVVGISGEKWGYVVWLEGSNHTLKNNIIYVDAADMQLLTGGGSGRIDYNCWYNVKGTASKVGTHDIVADPKFVNVATNDYHLQSTSPCIGAGEGGVDMGAYGVAGGGGGGAILPGEEIKVLNRPNPFRAGKQITWIEYDLSQASNVIITIYDSLGQEVWRKSYEAGENGGRVDDNIIPWDGRNSSGNVVANGGYVCRIWIERENKSIVRKIAVAK